MAAKISEGMVAYRESDGLFLGAYNTERGEGVIVDPDGLTQYTSLREWTEAVKGL